MQSHHSILVGYSSHVRDQERRALLYWRVWFCLMVALCGLLILQMGVFRPSTSVVLWLLYLAGAIAIVRQPLHGVYLVVFLALVGDASLVHSYPFVKNLSSGESLMFLGNEFIFSPLEIYLVLILIVWLARSAAERRLSFVGGPLLWPVLAFGAFTVFGLLYGMLRGGDTNVALWEARSLLYVPLFFVLVTNLVEKSSQASVLLWLVALALFIEGVVGVHYVLFILKGNLSGVNAITEHSAALHMNTLFVMSIAVWAYRGSTLKRAIFPLLLPAVTISYIATQRRLAFAALGLALLLSLIVLYRENRRAFFVVLPALGLACLVYLAVFWNSESALGLPAQAVKAVVAPDQLSDRDQGSSYYRFLENINIHSTIQSSPWLGIGFGHKFHQVVAMPDISWFPFWEYIPHNSIMWLWMKMGLGGFLVSLWLVGLALMRGAESLSRLPSGELKIAVLVSTTYVAMHFLYAYADMVWDAQSMLYLGMALGLISIGPRIAANLPVPSPRPGPGQSQSRAITISDAV